ncbi:MAG: hypothetical protein K9J16_14715 [Melioribacteraceae bacterium]|nr:hypothetical protein [Melioribacteraceae bacterium]MCF8355824.1 hypothetical protein [Melioribacteraceae bacterium]MCF8395283.1 hypothetical protein [Melioribacteraceae bacterium]MCF8420730.1 hypothetical protein [Melioribacteraceae bacterium]
MGSVQQMLILGGLILLSYLSLTYYNSRANQSEVVLFNENIISSTSVAQSMLEEIQSKAFDENTVSSGCNSPDELTSNISLGSDPDEEDPTSFDDIDDYDNFQKTFSLTRLGDYTVESHVYYINTMFPEVTSESPTFSKRIDVYVWNPFFGDTLTINTVVSY